MNNIDIENINKELAKRKAANYEWKDGGEMSKDDVMLRTTNELTSLKEEYEEKKKNEISEVIHKLVDDIFEKFGDEDDNMIPLSCANRPDYDIDGYTGGELYYRLTFKTNCSNNNIKPIGRTWYENEKDDLDKINEYCKAVNNLYYKTIKAKVPNAEDFWEDDGEALNEYWYGCIAITRDYKIVGFEIRYDGLPQNDERLNYPCIMNI